ncbi:MAG: response regulator, partial [Mucilaginibacter sp.]
MKKRILVIENDEDILHIVAHILTEEGYQVIPSRSEEGMIKIIVKEKPDIIILDVVKTTAAGTALC